MGLSLCVAQTENKIPYRFNGADISVYSIEEALYCVYHNWKKCIDDATSPAFYSWVADALEIPFIANRLKKIEEYEFFSDKMLAFLTIIPFFSKEALEEIKPKLIQWERRLEWETLKERADDLSERGEYEKAIPLYRLALGFGPNADLYNNLGAALMRCGQNKRATEVLNKAATMDENYLINFAEALTRAKEYERAKEIIKKLGNAGLFLSGDIALANDDPETALVFFQKALEQNPEEYFALRIADAHIALRQYNNGVEKLLEIINKNGATNALIIKLAELYKLLGDVPEAIRALSGIKGSAEAYTILASYQRQNYNLEAAEDAITKALALAPDSGRARMEAARIKKQAGDVKTYQKLMRQILTEFKHKYRNIH